MSKFDAEYWNNRYNDHDIGWDLGEVSPPLKAYIDQLKDTSIRILIPGGGNSYEAEYLFNKGFNNVFVVDVSETALKNIKSRVPNFPTKHLLCQNVFDLEMTFDLILEQTFFCAIHPKLRTTYVSKMHQLLANNGQLVGLLFNIPLNDTHPPFGGNKQLYLRYFEAYFTIDIMESCYNSIPERQGKELFIKLIK